MKKDKIRNNTTTKRKNASNQAENDHRQRFQKNTSTISENPIPRKATFSLVQPNPLIDYSPLLHLQSLVQPVPADQKQHTICFLPHLKASLHL